MGSIAHDAVIATCAGYVFDAPSVIGRGVIAPDVEAFRAGLPHEYQRLVVGPVRSTIGGYCTWAFLPDGSSEGWRVSDDADKFQAQFIALFDTAYGDGSSPFDVAIIRYGVEDAGVPSIRELHPWRPEITDADGIYDEMLDEDLPLRKAIRAFIDLVEATKALEVTRAAHGDALTALIIHAGITAPSPLMDAYHRTTEWYEGTFK